MENLHECNEFKDKFPQWHISSTVKCCQQGALTGRCNTLNWKGHDSSIICLCLQKVKLPKYLSSSTKCFSLLVLAKAETPITIAHSLCYCFQHITYTFRFSCICTDMNSTSYCMVRWEQMSSPLMTSTSTTSKHPEQPLWTPLQRLSKY